MSSGSTGTSLFGRLYYYLDKKHGYKQDDGTLVPLFSLKVGEDTHCVNFPLLVSVLASLQSEHLRSPGDHNLDHFADCVGIGFGRVGDLAFLVHQDPALDPSAARALDWYP